MSTKDKSIEDEGHKELLKGKIIQYLEGIENMFALFADDEIPEEQAVYLFTIRSNFKELLESWRKLQALEGKKGTDAYSSGNETETPTGQAVNSLSQILVVEDDEVSRVFAQRTLEKSGFTVTAVGDGTEALEVLKNKNFDLIVMDCQLPQMDGFETTRKIREFEKQNGKHIPILALTGHGIAGYKQRCLQVGMDDYMKKPVASTDLALRVKGWLEHIQAKEQKNQTP